jgi:nicotinamide-nucleotide amidase
VTTGAEGTAATRRILTAALFAVGSELTAGETQDTNGGELARRLAEAGVAVRGITALPDDLPLVRASFGEALATVDLLVATGGLGPTPDDLTREALAGSIDEVPEVDPELEDALRALFVRRGMPLPAVNLKQAWRIPSATSIPNPNGTAPGWWVDRPDGRVAVLLPGPPREMRPMWLDWVLPRLRDRGLGDGRVVRTLRTYGIGESVVAELLGETMLRAANPVVATYARADWLDVRISAVDVTDADGRLVLPAGRLLESTAASVQEILSGFVRAEGEESWAGVVARAAASAGVRLATVEAGTSGALAVLLGDLPVLERSTVLGPGTTGDSLAARLQDSARDAAEDAAVEIGVALAAWPDGTNTQVRAAVSTPDRGWSRSLELRLFQHGAHGRLRAAVAAAAFIADALHERTAAAGGDRVGPGPVSPGPVSPGPVSPG